MKRIVTAVVVGGLAVAMTACGSAGGGGGGGSSQGDYRVVVLGGIGAQGVLADNAATSVLSAQASVAYANKNGGVDGRKVTIDVIDDKADPTTAVTKLREYISQHKPDLVLNSGPSTIAAATLPILNQNRILSFNIGPTADSADPSKLPYNFDLSAGPADYAKGFVTYLKSKNISKVGILHGSSSYGETFGSTMESSLKAANIAVTSNQEYDVTALDMTPQLQTVQASSPDALILDAYGAPLGYILKNIEKLAWNVPIVADNSVAATGLISQPAPNGVLGTSQVANLVMEVYKSTEYNASATTVNDAVAAMKAIGPIKATLITAYNYDSMPLVMAAAKKAGKTDTESLAKALEDSSVTSSAKTAIISTYNFSSTNHSPQVGGDEFAFIPASPLSDGQFRPAT